MARTPLLHILRRAAAIAAHSRASGEPLDEVIERERALRVDAGRRRFLIRSVAAAAALSLPGCVRTPPRIASDSNSDAVVVVGAGIAGLTCAYRLRQAGVPVRIYEAQSRVGGRMFSLRGHFADGQVCELGGELIDSGHAHMHALAAELGLPLDDLEADPTTAYGDVWFANGSRHGEAEILREFAPLAAAIARDAASLPDADITFRAPGGAQALDALTVSEWLDRAGANGWLRTLIEVAYTTEMGLECNEQSALNLLTFIGSGDDHFRIFGESDERYHVRGGNDLVVQRLAAGLEGHIETGCVLESVAQDVDGRYRLSFARGAVAMQVRAYHVVLAIPFTTLRRVNLAVELPGWKQRAIADLRYGTNAKLMIGFNERVWRTRHAMSGSTYSDLPLQTTWETSRMQAGAAGILTNFVGGKHGVAIGEGTPAEQAAIAVSGLEAIFPGITAARAGAREARFHWPTHPWTLGSYACFTPGQWTTVRGAIGEPVGQLHFAGEHCSFDNQGFMEGGAETGAAVAARIVALRVRKAA